jgi:hypothetical protein
MKPATDIFITASQMVASIVVLPLVYEGQTMSYGQVRRGGGRGDAAGPLSCRGTATNPFGVSSSEQ